MAKFTPPPVVSTAATGPSPFLPPPAPGGHQLPSRSPLTILPLFPPPPTYPRPSADRNHGEVVQMTWSFVNNHYTYIYESGAKVIGPRSAPSTADVRFLHP